MPKLRPELVIVEDRRLQKNREPKIDFFVDFWDLRDPSNVINVSGYRLCQSRDFWFFSVTTVLVIWCNVAVLRPGREPLHARARSSPPWSGGAMVLRDGGSLWGMANEPSGALVASYE
jgi:hypothetical protein